MSLCWERDIQTFKETKARGCPRESGAPGPSRGRYQLCMENRLGGSCCLGSGRQVYKGSVIPKGSVWIGGLVDAARRSRQGLQRGSSWSPDLEEHGMEIGDHARQQAFALHGRVRGWGCPSLPGLARRLRAHKRPSHDGWIVGVTTGDFKHY